MASSSFVVDSSFRGGNEVLLKNYAKKAQQAISPTHQDVASKAEYSQLMLESLNEYRKTTLFCDVCLMVENEELLAHRNVLAASSPYFESLLNTCMREKGQYKISLTGLKAEILKGILHYIYLGNLMSTTTTTAMSSLENICDFLEASDYLMLGRLKTILVNHILNEHLNFNNCLSLWFCADRFQSPRLRTEAQQLVLANFYHLSKTDEFLGLDVSYLVELLQCEELASSDSEALDAVFAWINHDPNERLKYLDRLVIGNINLDMLPVGYIEESLSKSKIADNIYLDTIESSDVFKLLKSQQNWFDNNDDSTNLDGIDCDAASTDNVQYYGNIGLIVVGGWEKCKGGVADVNCYLPSVNQWFKLCDMSIPRYRHGIAVADGVVYALAGSVAADDCCVECLDFKLQALSWKRLLPMCSGIIGVAATALGGYVYVSGGFCSKTLNTAQRYSLAGNAWEDLSPMMQAREGHCLVACSGYVYAIGGSCGQDNSEVLKGVERYDSHHDSWSPVSPMTTQRNGACGVELNQHIYIIGGQCKVFTDGPMIKTNFRSCERYSPDLDQWDMIAELKFPRLRSCAAVVGHKIYVFGGFLHGGYLDTIECYDSGKGCWRVVGTSPAKLQGAACCAVNLDGRTISRLLLGKPDR